MTDVEKKHSELVNRMAMLEFEEVLDTSLLDRLKEEAEKLENYRYGWYVEIWSKGENTYYLTDDKNLCFGTSKTYFESYDEAKEYLDKADLDKVNYMFLFKKSRLFVDVRRPDGTVYQQEIQFIDNVNISISNFENYLGRGYKAVGWRKE